MLNGRKIFVEAGSDAHGDFNSGLGKSRTLVHSTTFGNNGILSALRDGHSIMTNGPVVIFDIGGTNIGDTRDMSNGRVSLNVQWNSTPEFGTVKNIIIIKGIIGDKETVERQIYPNSYSGNKRVTIMPSQDVYYRLEAMSTNGNKVYTNPIWINIVPTITVKGHIESGVEAGCTILRTDNGDTYELNYDGSLPPIGSYVLVTGTIMNDAVSICMQGPILKVKRISIIG